jgi:hypothetical protein
VLGQIDPNDKRTVTNIIRQKIRDRLQDLRSALKAEYWESRRNSYRDQIGGLTRQKEQQVKEKEGLENQLRGLKRDVRGPGRNGLGGSDSKPRDDEADKADMERLRKEIADHEGRIANLKREIQSLKDEWEKENSPAELRAPPGSLDAERAERERWNQHLDDLRRKGKSETEVQLEDINHLLMKLFGPGGPGPDILAAMGAMAAGAGGGKRRGGRSGGGGKGGTPTPPPGSNAVTPKQGAAPETGATTPNFNELPDSVLARIRRGDKKGRPFGTPQNRRMPTVEEFNPRVREVRAGDLEATIKSRMHPEIPEQAGPVGKLSNEDLARFRMEDPVSGVDAEGGLSLTGGHHRTAEIIRRVKAGQMSPDTIIRVVVHD